MIHCKNCSSEIRIDDVLFAAPYSWPSFQAVWYECVSCGTGNHVRFQDDEIQRIEIVGAPGPTWDIVEVAKAPGITIREDPGCLHVWHNGQHYEFPERESA